MNTQGGFRAFYNQRPDLVQMKEMGICLLSSVKVELGSLKSF